MKKILLMLLAVISFTSFVQAQQNEKDVPYIEVTGTGELEVLPNEIYIDITVDEKDYDGDKTIAEIEKSMFALFKKQDIDIEKQFSVKDMINDIQKYWLKSDATLTAKRYQLIAKSAEQTNAIFKGLKELGISDVTIAKLEHSDIDTLKLKLKKRPKCSQMLLIKILAQHCLFKSRAIIFTVAKCVLCQPVIVLD